MKPKRYSSEGIVLARRSYGEADRILIVYTKDFGKISTIAKGVRKPKSRKRGSLEVFSRVKFLAAAGRNLNIITETQIIDSYSLVRKDLSKTSLAYFFMEAVGRTSHEDEPNVDVYNLLVKYLSKLKTAEKLRQLRLDFILALLTLLGFWPKGKTMDNPDNILEDVVEREMSTVRVGKKLLS